MNQLITQEDFASIQQVQAGTSKLFEKAARRNRFYRVLRNQKPMGVLVPNNVWESLIEDLEALSNPAYLREIAMSMKEKKRYSADEVKKILKI